MIDITGGSLPYESTKIDGDVLIENFVLTGMHIYINIILFKNERISSK